ncbi:MAG: Molecular chaperone [Betaproteobacteria bacterium]|nr:Molecular chaperone [Betaproteobacteria bacterium]
MERQYFRVSSVCAERNFGIFLALYEAITPNRFFMRMDMNEYNRFPTDVFGELSRLQRHIDEVFRGPGPARDIRATTRTFPAINVGATADAVEIIALAPGVDPKKIDISIERGILTIAGERPQAEQDDHLNVYAQERFSGAFRRVVGLPDDIDPDRVEARYTDGCLRVTIKKLESSKPRAITIQ